ncbi:hypothetical protein FCL40_13475 [Ferrimonas sediminicola]|uniref:Uncharacterized protein n=1 Tax=Ferrimonas sediminicola TaxID=2569538 RepID=A0A4U1BB50_9GAMM|nr:hypothetical protein [Ferrimonas sediminicola]TKB48134.1 hypothetical protein FCL40_13475 [Ferrimonas sediminicola]
MSLVSCLSANNLMGFALVMLVLTYLLARKKVTSPLACSVLGFFSAFIPPLAIIFLVFLTLKTELPEYQSDRPETR